MNNIYFVSDSHWGHENIIRHCNRPWKQIEEHDEELIKRWNETVSRRDTVYHLGDFCMYPKTDGVPRMKLYRRLRQRLNGKIHLIRGNHDHMSQEVYNCFTKVYEFGTEIKINKQMIILCHYPMRSWNGSFRGNTYHLHGHVHGRLENIDTGVSCDVGIDVPDWNYSPVNWDVLKIKLDKKRKEWTTKFQKL